METKRKLCSLPTFTRVLSLIALTLMMLPAFSQGTDCSTAVPLTIGGPGVYGHTISSDIQSPPYISGCTTSGNQYFRREGWYQFTVSGSATPITISAWADQDLFLALFSSTGPCTGYYQIACANDHPNMGDGNYAEEQLSTVVGPGTYYLKVVNVGTNKEMSLDALEIYSRNDQCANAFPVEVDGACITGHMISDTIQDEPFINGCGGNSGNFKREGWYSFSVTDGPREITIAAEANWDPYIQLIGSDGNCSGLKTLVCANDEGNKGLNSRSVETITATLGNGTYYVKIVGLSADQDMKLHSLCITSAPCPGPSSLSGDYYLNNVKFLGTLEPDTANASGYSSGGYADYTGLPNKAKQVPGGGINVYFESNHTNMTKAWIDWDGNGVFGSNELVYNSGNVRLSSTTFGFVVPQGTAPGTYTLRIRTYDNTDTYLDFFPCGELDNGETEDYSFEVIEDCSAEIISVESAEKCGPGELSLSATGNGTSYRWYTQEFGGDPIPGETERTLETGSLPPGEHIYYVTAVNGNCESVKRTPVTATITGAPEIQFIPSEPNVCGDENHLLVTATGDYQTVELMREDFEDSTHGFNFSSLINNGTLINFRTEWKVKESTFIPEGVTWFPAISSGLQGDRFVFANSDVIPGLFGQFNINTAMTSNDSYDTSEMDALELTFDLYFSYYGDPEEGLFIEVSTDGSNWELAESITTGKGIGTRFERITADLSEFAGASDLKFRFRYNAKWSDGVAIDNIRFTGRLPLETTFNWSLNETGTLGVYEEDCETPYTDAVSVICIKPTIEQLTDFENWSILATAQLNGGCEAVGDVNVVNKTKIWDADLNKNYWNSNNWLPAAGKPDEDHCVIIKQPVVIQQDYKEKIKSLKLVDNGELIISSNATLTVEEAIISAQPANALVVESDGNLIQLDDEAENSADIIVKREVTDIFSDIQNQMDYIYWSAPVTGQNLHEFSEGTPAAPQHWAFLEYNEQNDYFDNTGDNNFVLGKGYAIRAEDGLGSSYSKTYEFEGSINNGIINIPITKNGDGNNLIGNPYPSNIDFDVFWGENQDLYSTAYFWTNDNSYSQYQHGGEYDGSNYAVYNGSGGIPSPALEGEVSEIPSGIIKVGQGFLVQKKEGGNSHVTFNNSMRTDGQAAFYSKDPKDRFWMTMTTPGNIVITTLLGYIPGATNGYDPDYDADFMGGSDGFYSLIEEDRKLLIQGREHPLDANDVVRFGVRCYAAGVHIIKITQREGVFEERQIYLRDKALGLEHNLSREDYKFFTPAGEFNDRFEIFYKERRFRSSASSIRQAISMTKEFNDILIFSTEQTMTEVELYDLSGARVYANAAVHSKELRIAGYNFGRGVLFAKIITADGKMTTRKMIIK